MSEPPPPGSLDGYFAAICSFDTESALGTVLALLRRGMSVVRVVEEVIAPAQVRVGELWERGLWSYADEHAVTAVTESVVAALFDAVVPARREGPRIVFACAAGELHSLPAQLAALVAASGGARVTLLSSPLDLDRLTARLVAGDVDMLALSCTMPINLVGAARCIQAAHEAEVPVLVGGRAFGSDAKRARATGADGFATSPVALLAPLSRWGGSSAPVPPDALVLDAVSPMGVHQAFERTMAGSRMAAGLSSAQMVLLREYLQWVAKHAGAALAVDDPVVLDDFLAWWQRPATHRLPTAVITVGARMVAEVVEPDAPEGALLLRAAAARVEPASR